MLANYIAIGLDNAQTHTLFPHSTYVTNASDNDWYHFDAEAGQTYIIETFNVMLDNTGRATGIYLYDENGIELAKDAYGQQGTGGANARITYSFGAAGPYYVLVKASPNREWTGTYSLRVLPQ